MAAALLTGEAFPYEVENLDPRTFPNAYVDEHAHQPGDQTVAELSTSTERLLEVLALGREGKRFPFFYPWPVDWPLVAAHLLWDARLHERDILIPARQVPASTATEVRAVLAYGLVLAAFNAGMAGYSLDQELVVGGSGAGRYRVSIGPGGVMVAVQPEGGGGASVRPDAEELSDSLAGRGPDVSEIFGRHDDLTSALSLMRAFLLAPA